MRIKAGKKSWKSQKGQTLMEYVLVVAAVTAAFMVMSTYVFRSVQATQQMIQEEFRK